MSTILGRGDSDRSAEASASRSNDNAASQPSPRSTVRFHGCQVPPMVAAVASASRKEKKNKKKKRKKEKEKEKRKRITRFPPPAPTQPTTTSPFSCLPPRTVPQAVPRRTWATSFLSWSSRRGLSWSSRRGHISHVGGFSEPLSTPQSTRFGSPDFLIDMGLSVPPLPR
ncbi:hypothetical protein VTK73DRAFT_4357 [Phialemonium thermophilum]|uniref:Uncharacterized protein n=1 Tax=Phialemonium thermophilum TaxID=223376 RepID=A0ABR3V8Z7_9PEZI